MPYLHLPIFSNSALLVIVGCAVGLMNAFGGGGTFIAFPFLLFLGIPAISANASATIATWPGTLAVMWAYRKELLFHKDKLVLFGLISLIGGGVGAGILLVLSNARFTQTIPYLLLFATCLFTFRIHVVRWIQDSPKLSGREKSPNIIIRLLFEGVLFVISMYAGFFGAGAGILLLAMLSMMGMDDIHKINVLRAFIGLSANTIGIIVFAVCGIVYWKQTALLGTGIVAGGYIGASYFRTIPSKYGQWIIVTVAWAITIMMFATHR